MSGSSTIGAPVSRIDGRAKVTGAARYAAEFDYPGLVHAVMVTSTAARGRVTAVDASAAERVPGVLAVLTHRNAPRLAPAEPSAGDASVAPPGGDVRGWAPQDGDVFSRVRRPLQSDAVAHQGEVVALAVAETPIAARRAAELVRVEYAAESPAVSLAAGAEAAFIPGKLLIPLPPESSHGDVEAALAAAPVVVDRRYHHPPEHHNPMELAATTAGWTADGELLVHDATQDVSGTRRTLAKSFGMPEERVRVLATFLGGGFGCKHPGRDHPVLVALAARAVGRPVRLVASRAQMFSTAVGHRPESIQRIRLGAGRDGRLLALEQDILVATSLDREFVEHIGAGTGVMYAAPARRVVHRAVALTIRTPTIMRAPGEAPGMFALESAIDELAVELGMDPIELRRRNEPPQDQERGVPFSSRSLIRCLEEGAARFGWTTRDPRPRSRQEGRWLVGTGVAAATYPTNRLGARAVAVLAADGRATIGTGGVDIGTGLYTIVAQVAAEELGLPVGAVDVRLADTALPKAPGAGGSWSTASIAPAVQSACAALRRRVADLAGADPASAPRGDALVALLRRANRAEATAEAESRPDMETVQRFSMHAFGAVFAEMAVDVDSGEARLRRMLGVYGCGRILNAKTARSQMIGGMVWGIGQALTEEGVLDPRTGHWVNGDLAEYHVPVNADVPALDVVFLDERDDRVNPLGVKGIGEIGIVGVAPAIANAVFHATDRRVRDLPITPAKLV